MTDTGGYGGTEAGYGPNTRTIMQIKVADISPAAEYDFTALEAAWESTNSQEGVFQRAQDPIIVGQGEALPGYDYLNRAYNTVFPSRWPNWGLSRIHDKSLTFQTVEGDVVTIPMKEKAIQDEMGETFDDYGRMAGNLGVMLPNPQPIGQQFILQEYSDPATEVFTVTATPLTPPLAGDGIQIWKITHNGVDTHPIHFHLFDVQIINRVGWDNFITLPAANELGWKDTIRVSPLEDTIVAMRPVLPELPFKLPDSIRVLEPMLPEGGTGNMFTNIDPLTGEGIVPPYVNSLYNFGWEYMWHCHILSHEEMMMMRPTAVYVSPAPASGLSAANSAGGVALEWTNNRSIAGPMYHPEVPLELPAATNFVVERATDAAFTQNVTQLTVEKLPKAPYADQEVVVFTDVSAGGGILYYYRVRSETDHGYSVWSAVASVSTSASSVPVTAGWNIIAGAAGSDVLGATLYGYDGTSYFTATGATMQAGQGYWAWFPAAGLLNIETVPAPVNVQLSIGWNLIGNPTPTDVSVPAGLTAYAFEGGSYSTKTVLKPGQGAWVHSTTVQNVVLEVTP
jgi:hypothetical protein